MKRKHHYTLNLIVLGLLFLVPGWNLIFQSFPDASDHENRRLAGIPVLNPARPDSFPPAFDKWFNDHFSFRNALLNARMDLDIHVLKQTPIPDYVIIGRDQWLYNTGHEIEVYQGTNRFTQEELIQLVDEMKKRQKFIESKGAKMMYAIIPVKYSVYPEFLPLNLKQVNKESRTDQFYRAMDSAGMKVIDLRKVLVKAKNDTFPVFYKNDSHWNYNGGFVAYQAIMKELKQLCPAVGEPLGRNDYKVTITPRLQGNLSKMLFIRDGCNDKDYTYVRTSPNTTRVDTVEKYVAPSYFTLTEAYEERYTNGRKSSPKILIIRDSFGYYMTLFLKEHFRETVSIFDAWEYKLNPKIIENEKPDIVLFLVLESFTDTWLDK